MTQALTPPASGASPAGSPLRGGYARSEVDVAALRSAEQGLELALAQPFGALFSALLPARSYRIRQLHLDYVDAARLGEQATYSAQVGEALEQGQALELRLLVARGAWLCVRGQAVLELGAAPQQHQQGNSHG
jgi:hypothetical protein